MRILVDADACPVKELILEIAKEHLISVLMYFDSSHEYENEYAKVFICDKGKDSVDFVILKNILDNDILVTNDYGLAALALTKKIDIITFNGLIIDKNNIDTLLDSRYLNAMLRKSNQKTKGPKKRNNSMDLAFKSNFSSLIKGMIT